MQWAFNVRCADELPHLRGKDARKSVIEARFRNFAASNDSNLCTFHLFRSLFWREMGRTEDAMRGFRDAAGTGFSDCFHKMSGIPFGNSSGFLDPEKTEEVDEAIEDRMNS